MKPAYHLNKQLWSVVTLDGTVPDSEVFWMVDHSYELILELLAKAERDSIGSESA